ncbi:Fanconi anemia group E protein isoform X3 [Phyllopteryx taeniolatus]|uniref:Fanconi anemia group E protein isoform X3 n=1 Tax=Phyllopteryx taeniolatus TaxID=161469 RepID=UPI002AD55C33|nr:Fanconi anemia group E protein isoform X3 [Phyllopteryx taeniolatus]
MYDVRRITIGNGQWLCGRVHQEMNARQFLSRFDGQWKLLARSLVSGVSGAHRALQVFRRQQRAHPERSLADFFETLCRDEITSPRMDGQPLTVEPLVWLFPALFKQNLLMLIYLIHSRFPEGAVLRLLRCLGQEPCPSPWVAAWKKQLERNMGSPSEEPLYSPACAQRLTALSQRVGGETGRWGECSGLQTEECQTVPYLSEMETGWKRKGHFDVLYDEDEGIQQQNKRMKTDDHIAGRAHDHDPLPEHMKIVEELNTDASHEMPAWENPHHPLPERTKTAEVLETKAPEQDNAHDPLPEHMKTSVLQIKELLQSQTSEVEVLCCELSLSDLAEDTLPQLCSSILALSPDLSFSTAATLIKNLLLQRVLSLSEPASRCLVSAVGSLCSRYTRSLCHALIGPLLEQDNLGSAQAELMNKLIEGCLDSHYRLLVLQMTLTISWSETLLSIIHSLLDSKFLFLQPDINDELFTQLTEQLVSQAPQFTKSVNFAKIMLTVLTKYGSLMNASHKHSLAGCLMLNETILKSTCLQSASSPLVYKPACSVHSLPPVRATACQNIQDHLHNLSSINCSSC